MQRRKKKRKRQNRGGRRGYLARRRRWLAAFLAALWRRLVALRLFPTVWFVLSVAPFLFVFFGLLFFSFVFGLILPLFPFLFSVFSFPSFPSLSFVLPLPLSLLCFFRFFSPSLLCFSLFFSSPSVLSFLSVHQRSWGPIYRAKGVALYCSHGEQTAGRPLVRLPRFGGWCAVGGRPLCPVGGLQAREWPAKIQKKASLFLPPRCVIGGKKMNSVVQNDTVLLFLFFFFFS